MTDFIRIHGFIGTTTLKYQGLWPPPERLVFKRVSELSKDEHEASIMREPRDDEEDYTLHHVACSELSDEMAAHPNLARGALYVYDPDNWDGQT